jgi:hypothetical protein
MNDNAGAEIIQFPRRPGLSVDVAARLDRAVRALEQASSKLRNESASLCRANNALIVGLGEIAESLQVLETHLIATLSRLEAGMRAHQPDGLDLDVGSTMLPRS